MINYQKIPFEAVKSMISSLFPNATMKHWELIPDHIHSLAKSTGIELQWKKIEWWHDFEHGNSVIPNAAFIQLLLGSIIPSDQKLVLITDDCFQDGKAYEISVKGFPEFVDSVYPDLHGSDFFQPNDFLLFAPEESFLALIHHEGYLVRLNL